MWTSDESDIGVDKIRMLAELTCIIHYVQTKTLNVMYLISKHKLTELTDMG